MLMRSKVTYQGQGSSEVKLEEMLKMKNSYLGLVWKVEVRLEPNLVYGYKMGTFICWWGQGHILRSKVIWGQVGRKVENEKLVIWVSFEKLKSDWNQTWFMDIKWEPSYVDEVKVTLGQRSSEVWKKGWKWKITLIWKVEVWLEPKWFMDINWEPSFVDEVKLSF